MTHGFSGTVGRRLLCGVFVGQLACRPSGGKTAAETGASQPRDHHSAIAPVPAPEAEPHGPWVPPIGEPQPVLAPPDPTPEKQSLFSPPIWELVRASRELLATGSDIRLLLFADAGAHHIESDWADDPCRVEFYKLEAKGKVLSEVRRLRYDSADRLVEELYHGARKGPPYHRLKYSYDGEALVEKFAYDLEKPSPDNPTITLYIWRLGYDAHGANVTVDVEGLDERESGPGDRSREDWLSLRYNREGLPSMSLEWNDGRAAGYTVYGWHSGRLTSLDSFSSTGKWTRSEAFTYDIHGRLTQSVVRRRVADGSYSSRIVSQSHSSEGDLTGIRIDSDGDGVADREIFIQRESLRTTWRAVDLLSRTVLWTRTETLVLGKGGAIEKTNERFNSEGKLSSQSRKSLDAEGRIRSMESMKGDEGTLELFFYSCRGAALPA